MSENRLVAYKCKKCGAIVYPKRFLCSSCRGRDFEEYPLGGEGKVLTYTKLWAIPEGIEFDGKVRVTGQVLSEEVKTGDRVRPVWGHIRKVRGKEIQGFRFELIS